MPVFNPQTQAVEEPDPVLAAEGLASGKYLPPPGQGILISPENSLVYMPIDQVKQSVEAFGYRVPTPDEIRKTGRDYLYSQDKMQAQAALAGLARGGSFGVSDWMAIKTGLTSPEHLSALKEYFPGTTLAGEIGGAIATAPFKFTPAGVVSTVASGAAAKALGKAASVLPASSAANVIAKTAADAGSTALGGAIEGLAYGLGQTVSEAALGDPDLNAEKIIADLGHAAILGGAFGAAFNVGGKIIKKTLEKSKSIYQQSFDKLFGKHVAGDGSIPKESSLPNFENVGMADEMEGALAGLLQKEVDESVVKPGDTVFEPGWLTKKLSKAGASISDIPEEELVANFAAQLDPKKIKITTAQKDEKVNEFVENMQKLYETSIDLTKKMSKNVRPKEMENLLADIAPMAPQHQYETVISNLKNAVTTMKQDPLLYDPYILRKSEKILERMDQKNSEGFFKSVEIYDDLINTRRLLEDLEKFDKLTVSRQEQEALSNFITPIRTQIKDGLTDVNVWGEAGARQAAYNEKIHSLMTWRKALEKIVMTKTFAGEARPVYEINPRKINMMFNQINDTRSKWPTRATANFIKSFREYIEESEFSIIKAQDDKIDIKAVKNFANKLSEDALNAKQYVSDSFGGYGFFRDLFDAAKQGGLGGIAASIGEKAINPSTWADSLGKLETTIKKTSKKIEEKTGPILEKMRVPTIGIGILMEKSTEKERKEKYDKAIKDLKSLNDFQENLIETIEKTTSDSFEVAPKTSSALQSSLLKGIAFLQSKIPEPLPKGPYDTDYAPSNAQISKFLRYYDSVQNPLIVLNQLEDNHVFPETVETLQNVFPKLYNEIKTSLVDKMAQNLSKNNEKPDYQKRVVLSKFLGISLDSSLRSNVFAANQAVLRKLYGEAKEKEAQEQAVQRDIANVSLAERTKNKTENVITRA